MAKKAKKAAKKSAPKRAIKKVVATKVAAKKIVAKNVAAKKAAPKKTAAKKAPARKTAVSAPPKLRGSELGSFAAGFTANDAEATIKWYSAVLGFKVIERWEHEGQFMGAQIGSGGVIINVSQDDWKQGRDRVKGAGTRLYITMGPDVDGFAEAVKARGGTLSHEPRTEWNMRAFSMKDLDGYNLTFFHELGK